MQALHAMAEQTTQTPYGVDPDANYLVLLTEPNRETTAQANLMLRRIPFYLPTIFRCGRLSASRHASRAPRPDIAIPLFPRTLFIPHAVVDREFYRISTSPGMLSHPLMRFGDEVAMIRPADMRKICDIEAYLRDCHFARKRKANAPGYVPAIGEHVRVLLDEVLGGTQGTVSAIDGKGRITLLTEIMKRSVRVKVNANQIEPV